MVNIVVFHAVDLGSIPGQFVFFLFFFFFLRCKAEMFPSCTLFIRNFFKKFFPKALNVTIFIENLD